MVISRHIPALWFTAAVVLSAQPGHNRYYSSQTLWGGIEIDSSGRVEFTDDDADVRSLSGDGYFKLEQRSFDGTKTFIATRGPSGEPHRVYSVNGSTKPLDAGAKAWLARTLPKYILESAIDAPARVQRIRSRRGVAGVLGEIGKIESDGSRRIYLHELLRSGGLKPEELREAMRQARRISSDGEKATLLAAVAGDYRSAEVREDYFHTVDTISSDGEHRRVLSSIVRNYGDDPETMAQSLKSARRISSDGEKAQLLVEVSGRMLVSRTPQLRKKFFDAAATISSDGEHRRVLDVLLTRPGLDVETLRDLAESTAAISSDGEKGAVLTKFANLDLREAVTRDGFFDAANTISSDGVRAQVLIAAVGRGHLDKQGLVQLVASARGISSDGEKASVLGRVVEVYGRDADVSAAVRKAAGTISSDGEYRRVMSLLAR